MIIKKYQALNEQDAIILAKEELGKNVIIMNVEKITPKGLAKLFKKAKVEVTAAIDDEKSYESKEDKKEMLEARLQSVLEEKTQELGGKSKTSKKASKNKKRQEKELKKVEMAKNIDLSKDIDKVKDIDLTKDKVKNTELTKDIDKVKDKATSDEVQKLKALLDEKSRELDKMTRSLEETKEEAKKLATSQKIVIKDNYIKDSIIKESSIKESSSKESLKKNDIKEVSTEIKSSKGAKDEKSDKYVRLIKKQLLRHEVDEKFIDMIIDEVKGNIKKDTMVDNILTSVYQKIILKLGTPKLIEPGENQPKYVFFMGPTGVGKTTTIAKIASDFKLNRKLNVAFLTSDTYRIAAVEQLRIYANILKIPMKVAYSAEDIVKLKPQLDRYDIVLVDTAGRSHKNKEQGDDLRELIGTIDKEERDTYLVLSATTKYSDLQNIVEAYSDIEDYKLLFTKTDETTHLGNILNVKLLTDAKLSYIADGQDVPTDIGKVDAQDIAKQLLGGGM